ncbi:unnamed protein product [Parnassius apollo]|uniref:(apollo) hypothetical protein n=2 Tax=Parnassius apollo TaxID=110799 RepID=A0A8S3WTE2_PARAO|nr:unnamed protein product [Parnassius apollo]
MICGGCRLLLNTDCSLHCHTCDINYHYECLNINKEQFVTLSKEFRSSWTCPACVNVTRRIKTNLSTPVRHNQVPSTEQSMDLSCEIVNKSEAHIPSDSDSIEKFNELLNTINLWRNDMNSNIMSIRDEIKNDMNSNFMSIREEIKNTLSDIQSEIKSLREEQATLRQNVSNINIELSSLQNSIQFQSDEHGTLKHRVDEIARVAGEQTTSATAGLQYRIDSLEQQARQTNVEICNVPERRNENLIGIIEAIGTAIRFPISKADIVSIHRVPHAHSTNDRPKNIIAKFSTRIQRDNIIAAYRKAKSLREKDDSPVLVIRGEDDLKKLRITKKK